MSTPRILVIGELLTDVIAYVDDPIAIASDTRARILMRPGGTGGNVAAWIATLGGRVRLAGRIGDDAAGHGLERELRRRGVESRLIRTPGAATGAVIALVDQKGERTMLPDAGANAHLSAQDLEPSLFDDVSHVHISGYVLLDERSRDAAIASVSMAKDRGLTTSIDPSSSALIDAMGVSRFLGVTEGIDVILPARAEGRALSGRDEPSDIVDALLSTYAEVAVTLGADGALWGARDIADQVFVAAETLTLPLVDSVGAGDAFVAGWLSRRVVDGEPLECLRQGCRAGARAVVTPGAWP